MAAEQVDGGSCQGSQSSENQVVQWSGQDSNEKTAGSTERGAAGQDQAVFSGLSCKVSLVLGKGKTGFELMVQCREIDGFQVGACRIEAGNRAMEVGTVQVDLIAEIGKPFLEGVP